MKCTAVRNRILALETPQALPHELAAHVNECSGCEQWHRKVVAVEQTLPRLPVAATTAKTALLQKLKAKPGINRLDGDLPLALPTDSGRLRRAVGEYWPVGLVAATLLIATFGMLNLREPRPTPVVASRADKLLYDLVDLNVKLAQARVAAERVKILADVAGQLNGEMLDIARADATGARHARSARNVS